MLSRLSIFPPYQDNGYGTQIVNMLNNFSPALRDNSGKGYKNGHMMAATFGGGNNPANIATWIEPMEALWSAKENEIRKGGSPNEQGYVTVQVNFPENITVDQIAGEILDKTEEELQKPERWRHVQDKKPPIEIDWEKDKQKIKSKISGYLGPKINYAITNIPDRASISYVSSQRRINGQYAGATIANLITGDKNDCTKFLEKHVCLKLKTYTFDASDITIPTVPL